MGTTIVQYHAANGLFTAEEFQEELAKMEQQLTLRGVGAHHQNAVAERALGTVSAMARRMMLHAKLRWLIAAELWSMSVSYALYFYNHSPKENNLCPFEIFLKATVPRVNWLDRPEAARREEKF
jgi:hypothetical protein